MTHPAGFEALLDELAESRAERATMRLALEALAYAPTQVEPPPGLRDTVLGSSRKTSFEEDGSLFVRAAMLPWQQLSPGVELKDLHFDAGSGARTTLIRMAPDSPFPPHPHGFVEDLYVIEGDAWVGDVYMSAGDYCRAAAGSEHNHVRSGGLGTLTLVVSR